MLRELLVGLCVLSSIGCGGLDPTDQQRRQALTPETDGGAPAACDWYVYWLTMVDREEPCNWGLSSKNTAVTLFRTKGGECLVPADICGVPACADLTFVREKQVVEIWGPAGLEADDVWREIEQFDCE